GKKEYAFKLARDGIYTDIGSIFIEKSLGVDAYLKDVIFATTSDSNVITPRIYVSDANGKPDESIIYHPMFYYNGIDYAGHDEDGKKHFRIDGIVSSEDLQFYSPKFIMPAGSKMQLYKEDGGWVEVEPTDYLGIDVEEKVVMYRVIPEKDI